MSPSPAAPCSAGVRSAPGLPRLIWRLLVGPCLAAAWKYDKAEVIAVTYMERMALEPYLEHEVVYLQGSVRQTGAGEQVMEFTGWDGIASHQDVVKVVLRSDDDFELRSLDDCWLPKWGYTPENCCGAAHDPSCFAGIFSFERCCEVNALSKAFLKGNMAEARRMASPLVPRYRIDEGKFERRRLGLRHGEHAEDCRVRIPEEPLPPSIAALEITETGIRAAFNVLRDAGRATRKGLQVGVNDGRSDDSLYHLIVMEELSGVGLESDPELVNVSRQNLPGRFQTIQAFATPHNIWQYAGPIGEMDLVMIDIDSYDCVLMEALLDHANARHKRTGVPGPALFQIETNTMIPPPFAYVRDYAKAKPSSQPDWQRHKQLATTSCSLSYAVDVFRRRGYELLFFGYDTIFVRRDLAPLYTEAWGHKFPKDEFACYRQAVVNSCNTPMRYIREWFFNADDPHDLMKTRQLIATNMTQLCHWDGLDPDAMRLYPIV
mmetsp:Transcript_22925/g.68253  ORF Transcript_22925/g.68253 Transcript_22925/m.68253 type:complete len:490 (-) Transcript_22925:87-1556(-)